MLLLLNVAGLNVASCSTSVELFSLPCSNSGKGWILSISAISVRVIAHVKCLCSLITKTFNQIYLLY